MKHKKIIVDNEYASEKLSAIFCLEEITKYLNPQIIDYYDDCYAELKNLSLFVHMNIRKESYLGLANLISYLHDYCNANLEKMNETNRNKLIQTFSNSLKEFYQNSINTIKMDANRQLVMTVYDACKTLLFRCAPFIKRHFTEYSKALEEYGTLIIETFSNKVALKTLYLFFAFFLTLFLFIKRFIAKSKTRMMIAMISKKTKLNMITC